MNQENLNIVWKLQRQEYKVNYSRNCYLPVKLEVNVYTETIKLYLRARSFTEPCKALRAALN